MAIPLPRPLHTQSAEELVAAARDQRWPKWQTMALLHSLGLPTLNAALLRPGQSPADIRTAAHALATTLGTDRLMIRSDGGVEKKAYYRGGNTFPIGEIAHRAQPLLADGRAVILAGPTNRFTNKLTVMIRMDRPGPGIRGTFTLEALGPGYDVADLTRGELPPQVTAQLDDVDWDRYTTPAGTSGSSAATTAPAGRKHAGAAAWSASRPRPWPTADNSPETLSPSTPKRGSANTAICNCSAPRTRARP